MRDREMERWREREIDRERMRERESEGDREEKRYIYKSVREWDTEIEIKRDRER